MQHVKLDSNENIQFSVNPPLIMSNTVYVLHVKSPLQSDSVTQQTLIHNKCLSSIAARNENTPDEVIQEFKSKMECVYMEDFLKAPLKNGLCNKDWQIWCVNVIP